MFLLLFSTHLRGYVTVLLSSMIGNKDEILVGEYPPYICGGNFQHNFETSTYTLI